MNKRSTKFYRKNEAEVMRRLGLRETKNSGAGWIEKCDGQSEDFICELKSTDNESYGLKQSVLHTLEYHACVAHKTPVFALQFLNTDEIWVAIKEDDFRAYKEYVEQKRKQEEKEIDVDNEEEQSYNICMGSRNVGKTYLARQAYMKQREKERKQREQEFKTKQRERRRNIGKKIQAKRNCDI